MNALQIGQSVSLVNWDVPSFYYVRVWMIENGGRLASKLHEVFSAILFYSNIKIQFALVFRMGPYFMVWLSLLPLEQELLLF